MSSLNRFITLMLRAMLPPLKALLHEAFWFARRRRGRPVLTSVLVKGKRTRDGHGKKLRAWR